MDLVIWRHADAVDGYPDHERELSAKGRQQAKHMAAWLNARLPADATLLVSPAVRAQQTAAALKRAFNTCDAIEPGADYTAVFDAHATLGAPQSDGVTLIVGHQPTLGQVASRLLTGAEGDLSIKKGAVWWFTLRRNRIDLAALRAVMTPGML
jgi:phosphohistidine phosphatase